MLKKFLVTSSCVLLLSGCSKEEKEIKVHIPSNIESYSKEAPSENKKDTTNKNIIDDNNTIKDTVDFTIDKVTDFYENTTQEDIKNTAKGIYDVGEKNVNEFGEIISNVYNNDTVQNKIDKTKETVKNGFSKILK